MGALVRSMDWGKTPLGPVHAWPQSLRTTVSLCLSSTFPILIAWGKERVQIYNDAYRPICGEKHPQSMGQPFNECWASALQAVGEIVDRAQGGSGSYLENLRMFLDRYGYLEEAFMTFSFSPIRDETGGVGGLFHPITETTEKMLSARRTQALRELAASLGESKSLDDIGGRITRVYGHLELDVPFLLFYEIDETGASARLLAHVGLSPDCGAAPAEVSLDEARGWDLGSAVRAGTVQEVDDLARRFAGLVSGPYPEPPASALIVPIQQPGLTRAVACLIAGVSARRALDASYRAFYEVLGATITTAVSNVRAYEQEQRRAEALAQIDRAKTAFFSNVSHEFRTPLTLMLGPLEDGLADTVHPLPHPQRERQELVHRSGLRLLKLVNTLLDFSRIEAGRVQAAYEQTDLSALCRDLASAFRSAIEKAGLRLVVDCPPSPITAWVDRDMWEKIVLNLLSNAFKHTFEGGITLRLREHDRRIDLTVQDTGVGIPAHEVPRLFERFHRVEGTRGRSYEGSGIGLALVQELVRLHSGTVQVDSRVDQGTTFTISIPAGSAHLPKERLNAQRTMVSTATRVDAFVHEVAGWSGRTPAQAERTPDLSPDLSLPPPESRLPLAPQATAQVVRRVLVADDNADMREYIQRLLGGKYAVEVVADGHAALAAVQRRLPDLVLSDVMMPRLDGFGLLRALKADPRTAALPVILLSARAGEEATLEGLSAGASDYLVKPFGARELLARIEGAIQIARERTRMAEVLETMGDAFYMVDRSWRFTLVNASHERVTRRPRSETLGQVVWDLFPEAAHPDSRYWIELHRCMEERVSVHFVEYYRPLSLWTDVKAYPTPGGITVFFRDVSEEKRAQATRERQAEFEQQLVGIVSHDLRNPLNAILLGTTLLEDPPLAGHAEATVRRIRSNGERAVRLVRDLLDFTQARLGAGIPVVRRPLDLNTVIEQALEDTRMAFPGREIAYQAGTHGSGAWDADRIAQVVHNLTTNALKYSPPGSPVHVASRGSDTELILSVHNTGDPIPAALLPEIFMPLRRGADETERKNGSIGFGLFIVDEIVRAHGGAVSVSSSASEGTTFEVRLLRSAPISKSI